MQPRSLSTRLLASVSILLIVFFGITIAALDFAFRRVTEQAMRDRLEAQLLALISASEEDSSGGLQPAPEKTEERLKNPGSGLYGEILRSDGYPSWRSNSLTGTGLDFAVQLPSGQRQYRQLQRGDGSPVRALEPQHRVGIRQRRDAHFRVQRRGGSRAVLRAAESLPRCSCSAGSALLMLLLLGALAFLLRRLLAPLRRVEREIEEIEAGRMTELGAGYPRELLGITTNLNALLRSERERLARYRNTLGNLAHSFKTPLAVMRNLLSGAQARELPVAQAARRAGRAHGRHRQVSAQARRRIGRHRARHRAGRRAQRRSNALRGALLKVYAERSIDLRAVVADGCLFTGDREDLTEIAGNLLDNAFKWARRRVR